MVRPWASTGTVCGSLEYCESGPETSLRLSPGPAQQWPLQTPWLSVSPDLFLGSHLHFGKGSHPCSGSTGPSLGTRLSRETVPLTSVRREQERPAVNRMQDQRQTTPGSREGREGPRPRPRPRPQSTAREQAEGPGALPLDEDRPQLRWGHANALWETRTMLAFQYPVTCARENVLSLFLF